MQPFIQRVKQALEAPERLAAIDLGARRKVSRSIEVMATLPDPEALRDHARAIRAHTIANLDRYLEQFEANVVAVGGKVHWAQDAAEANAIVTQIARQVGARAVVKSKSMVTEEIGLNAALESTGLRVVETDLGEFIAQLGNDRPSHIIAPVLHWTKEEVGALFADRLGVPLTTEIAALNAIARQALREEFLSADMGISGANFGVAETGSICLVTNEGNGRMVVTLPRVHVALMGIERLVPTLDDLTVMLQLLARNATGQKITVYTTLVTGPRRAGEIYGPDEVHVVLVDNGRARALAGDLAEILYCIRCGACLNICPVYRTIGGHAYGGVYPGPMGSVISPILGGLPAYAELPHASTLCGACREICPVRIDLPTLLIRLRHETVVRGFSAWWWRVGMGLYTSVATRIRHFRMVVRLSSWATRLLGRGEWITSLPGPLKAWTRHRHFPSFAAQTFTERWEARRERKP